MSAADAAPRSRVLFAHERRAISRAVEIALDAHGFEIVVVEHGDDAARRLRETRVDALVVDVGIPGKASFELVNVARAAGVAAVILVASIYSRTSYKRSPQRLYGADDYVEIHHLGDQLPRKLRRLLGQAPVEHDNVAALVADLLKSEGDRRLAEPWSPRRIAALVAADLVLYNGDAVARAETPEEARELLARDLAGAREVFARARAGVSLDREVDHVGEALDALLEDLLASTRGTVGEAGA